MSDVFTMPGSHLPGIVVCRANGPGDAVNRPSDRVVSSARWLCTVSLLTIPHLVATLPGQDPLKDPKDAKTVREALISLAKRATPDKSLGPVRAQLDVFVLEAREALAKAMTPEAKARALSAYFFEPPKLSAGTDLADPALFYVDRVLEGREGFCLALSAIVLATAEDLGLPVFCVASPRHMFVRYDDGKNRFNIETTDRGRLLEDSYYRSQGIDPAAEHEGLYLRNLDTREVIAHLLNNEGYIHWIKGERNVAEKRFHEALSLHPTLVEAHVNLGVVAGDRGELKAASEHFDRVLRWVPSDASTLLNRALAHVRSGDVEAALSDLDLASGLSANSPALLHWRNGILATILQPETWERHQASIVARGEALRAQRKLRSGLRGSYFPNRSLGGKPTFRIDREIAFEWRYDAPMRSIPPDDFSVRWDGLVEIPEDGTYSFLTVANDGVRVSVDGLRLIDNWKENEGALDRQNLKVRKGLHTLRVEFFEISRFAGITFRVKKADANQALPKESFWHVE